MAAAKIEPRLSWEIERVGHHTAEPIPVLIEHAERAQVADGGDLAELEQTVLARQQEILDHLETLGVNRHIELLVLANALATELTPAQIEAVAQLTAVKVVRLNRPQQVTSAQR